MNKKIKIIDIFKRIEKHEDIPQNIKYEDNCYTFKHTNYSIDHLYELKESCIGWLEHKDIKVFDEVEILEDNTQEIEELDKIHTTLFDELPEDVKINYLRGFIQEDREIINKLVKVVNKMKEGKE